MKEFGDKKVSEHALVRTMLSIMAMNSFETGLLVKISSQNENQFKRYDPQESLHRGFI